MSDSFAADAGQRVDSQGRVTYEFAGRIQAQGVDLDPSNTTSGGGQSKWSIRWRSPSRQTFPIAGSAAEIQGFDVGSWTGLTLTAASAAAGRPAAQLTVAGSGVDSPGVERPAQLSVVLPDAPAGAAAQRTWLVVDEQRRSDFLRLAEGAGTLGGRAIAFGRNTINFGGAAQSNVTIVPHGLGVAPIAVVATSFTAPSFGAIPNLNPHTFTTVDFGINGETSAPWTGAIGFSWVAIG